MKIAVITFVDNGNYGSELQAIALNGFLKSRGHDVVFVKVSSKYKIIRGIRYYRDWLIARLHSLFDAEYKCFYYSLKENSKTQRQISPQLRKKISSYVSSQLNIRRITRSGLRSAGMDLFICGSDQIWSPVITPFRRELYLDFVSQERKIAYAPSIGLDVPPAFFQKKAMKYICDFKYLSVREVQAQKLIEQCTGKHAELVLDPTLMVGLDFWKHIVEAHTYAKKLPEQYCVCYFLGCINDDVKALIQRLSKGLPMVIMPYRDTELDNSIYCCADPVEFVSIIRDAEYVFTDSYHGTIFSLLFEREFTVFIRSHKSEVAQTSRIQSLLMMLGQKSRICHDPNTYCVSGRVDYSAVSRLLSLKQEKSRTFLSEALLQISSEPPELSDFRA